MLELILLASGFALLIFCSVLPHENTDGVATILFSRLKFKRGHPKLRLDLPKTTELLWKGSVELRKVPLVLDERNELALKLLPISGDRLGANIEVPLTSTADLRNISVEVITATFDVERMGHPLLFSISSATEATFRITPRVLGDGQIRFEFWQGENLRGRIDEVFKVKSKQYGITLPANLTLILKFVAILLSTAGAILGLVKFFIH